MANQHTVFAWFGRLIGYTAADVAKFTGIVTQNAPEIEAVLTDVANTEQLDAAAFAAGKAVVSPSVGASVQGHAYKITVHFDPA